MEAEDSVFEFQINNQINPNKEHLNKLELSSMAAVIQKSCHNFVDELFT